MAKEDIAHDRLKAARAEIAQVLVKYDIAGLVVLHAWEGKSGYGEFFYDLTPSYSILKFSPGAGLRIRFKLADYAGNKEAQMQDQAGTANMLSVMVDGYNLHYGNLLAMKTMVDEAVGAVHERPVFKLDDDPLRGT